MADLPHKARSDFLRFPLILTFCLTLLFQMTAGISGHAYDGVARIDLTEKEKVWLAEHPVIHVGDSSEFEPELIRNPDGTYSGTLVDIFRLLEERLGIRFEIVDDKWPEVLRRAGKKEIDLVGLMNKDVAEKMGLITIEAPYNVLVTAFARKDRRFKMVQDKDIEGLRVAYYREIVFLRKHFESFKGRIDVVEAASPLDALKLLLDKKADVMVGFNEDSYLLQKYSIREIEPIYTFKGLHSNTGTAVRPDEPLLASILSKAFNSISHKERDEILSKWTWIPDKKERVINLSPEEETWLAGHPVIRVGNSVDWPPFGFVQDDRFTGISADYINHIGEILNIRFEAAKLDSWQSTVDAAQRGELDLLASVVPTPQLKKYLIFTRPYLSYSMAIVTLGDVPFIADLNELNFERVAVTSGSTAHEFLMNNHPDYTIYPVKNVSEGLMAVTQRQAVAYIDNLPTISYLIAREGLSGLKISGEMPYRYDIAIGISKNKPLLASAIKKALDSITKEQHTAMQRKWLSVTFEQKADYTLLWQVMGAVIIVLAAITYWNRRLTIEIKNRHQVEEELRNVNEASLKILEDLRREIEERKVIEVALRRLTVAVEQNPAAIIITDLEGSMEYVNPRFTKSTGYTAREAIGQNPRILKSGYQSEAFYKELWETITAGKTWRGDFLNKKKNGELYWESASISPIKDEKGDIINYVGIKLDITDRKEAEDNLHREKNRMQRYLETVEAIIVSLDVDGKITLINRKGCELLGYEEKELLGKNWFETCLPQPEEEEVLHVFKGIMAGHLESASYYENEILTRDGKRLLIAWHNNYLLDDEGNITGTISAGEDITERKLAEEALKKSEASLAMAQKIAHIGNWEWNIKDNELYWSAEIYCIFGLKPRQFAETYEAFVSFVHPDDRPRLEDAVRKALEGMERYSIDHRLILTDGTEKTVHEEGEVEFDENGGAVRMMGTVHDITERKKIEEALHKAKEEAEEATKLKDKFVSLVSHDLKNPIHRTVMYLDLLREWEEANDDAKEIIDNAMDACNEMTILINEVFKLSRIRSGRIIPDYSFVHVHSIADMAIKNYARIAADKEIELINETPESGRIYADEKLLLEVLRNLVSNAVKFCRKGDQIRMFIPNGAPATFAVADTGVGISRERLGSLFQYEEKTSTLGTAGEKGTGFGLPLCHDIVTAHGGTLEVESEIDKGSTFYVKLPHIIPKVLIVDNDESARKLFREILDKLDITILEADKYEIALEIIEKNRPQLFFIDLHMPGMSGLQLLDDIKKDSETKKIPVIVVTADRTMEVVDQAFQRGADDFILKPFEKEGLIESVNRFIG